jgi:hypothetical protein
MGDDLFPPSQQPLREGASGRHMIEGLDALILHGQAKRSRAWRDQAGMIHLFQNCIRAEADRADRAEAKVAFYEANTNIRPPERSGG